MTTWLRDQEILAVVKQGMRDLIPAHRRTGVSPYYIRTQLVSRGTDLTNGDIGKALDSLIRQGALIETHRIFSDLPFVAIPGGFRRRKWGLDVAS